MKRSDFQYELPPGRIAQQPISPRDHSRLMVIDSRAGQIDHRRFYELERLLRPGDVLVANATRVFPARLRGQKKTGGKIEVLLLGSDTKEKLSTVAGIEQSVWRALVRGSIQPIDLFFEEGVRARMEERLDHGEWLVRFFADDFRAFLERYGEMPLPPYIKRPKAEARDQERYQTVYARDEGAVAAPTAGFHFTDALLGRLRDRGVEWLEVVLHVGWGTFRPIREEEVTRHQMLPEFYDVTSVAAEALNQARRQGRRIIAIGTTVVRTLETVTDAQGSFRSGQGKSDLFITPGYHFKSIDALITNFHLPDSTPLLLANAFYAHKRAQAPTPPFALRAAYDEAIQEGYRFYSYGDAMLIQ